MGVAAAGEGDLGPPSYSNRERERETHLTMKPLYNTDTFGTFGKVSFFHKCPLF